MERLLPCPVSTSLAITMTDIYFLCHPIKPSTRFRQMQISVTMMVKICHFYIQFIGYVAISGFCVWILLFKLKNVRLAFYLWAQRVPIDVPIQMYFMTLWHALYAFFFSSPNWFK